MKFPDFPALTKRIEKLHSRSSGEKGQWGKMNLGQMLVHCRMPYELALGRIKAKPEDNFFSRNIMRPLILKIPWPKGKSPTFRDFRTVELNLPVRGMADEIGALLEVMQAHAARTFDKTIHPLLGPMSLAEWEGLQRRHLDYHLRQFAA